MAAETPTPRGVIVYEGPSRLTGDPIIAVLTLDSQNSKTGNMVQAWVLRSDVSPHEAIKDGRDRAICGDCVHRSGTNIGRTCYVLTYFGPNTVFKSLRKGYYARVTPEVAAREIAGRAVRLAAYGDPAAVPFAVWRAVLVHAGRLAAYTHQFKTADQRLRQFCMASVETEAEAEYAHALGWRTFRARRPIDPLRADEITCPASDEAGHRTTCDRCGLCSGLTRPTARSIAILLHGQRVAWLNPSEVSA